MDSDDRRKRNCNARLPPSPPYNHRQAAARPHGHAMHWPDHMTRRQLQCEMPHDGRDNDRGLMQGKGGADADARADAEGQIGKSIDALARTVEETIRIKRVCLLYTSPSPRD